MRGGGTGLMGEAGPEAIMPLARGADGKLGVQARGGGGDVNVVMNVTTPDVAGFRRSQSQIAAQLGRVIGRGARNR
jgi:phage-related minor tail protein